MIKVPRVPARTTPGFAFSMVDRALSECLGRRDFRIPGIEKTLKSFSQENPECVFCGSQEVKRWDHLVPIKSWGETVIGNMVSACAQCDDSKRDVPFDQWMVSNNQYSLKMRGVPDVDVRRSRIQGYIDTYNYRPRDFKERLTPEELVRLEAIQTSLINLRSQIDQLIQDYRNRTGEE
jgi:hypothetical protein